MITNDLKLFRGKDSIGLWRYGYYYPLYYSLFSKRRGAIREPDGGEVEVDMETVGRTADCTDINDNVIFEGDIVKYYKVESSGNGWDEPSESWIKEVYGLVAYHMGSLCLEHCWEMPIAGLSKEMRSEVTDDIMIHDAYNLDEFPNIKSDADLFLAEIVGNKYDNPELLELIEE